MGNEDTWSGWAKRGPSGVVATNVPDARETVASVVEDLDGRTATTAAADPDLALAADATETTHWAHWRAIDDAETAAGAALSPPAPRVKLDSVDAMLDVARA